MFSSGSVTNALTNPKPQGLGTPVRARLATAALLAANRTGCRPRFLYYARGGVNRPRERA
jgi:hypothetical protein